MSVDRRVLAGSAGPERGGAECLPGAGRSDLSAGAGGRDVEPVGLWDEFVDPRNLSVALLRVRANRGAAGVDGMTTGEIAPWLMVHWEQVRVALDEDTYRPSPVRRVVIPKPGGGERLLGVPTVLDRVIQQALAQVLARVFDPGFSPLSFGFRPGRSAHQAVEVSRRFIEDGYRWVVDVDLEKFFDRVNHDALMARVARKVSDRRVLRLVRRFLDAGVMVEGVRQPVVEGTPQGSPLSPLLSNIMLDDLDRELSARGLRFVRYADDLRVFVRSKRAAQRVLDGVIKVVEGRLKLRVNREKSSVQPANAAVFLGFGFFFAAGGLVKVRVAPKAIDRLRTRLRELTRRNWGVSMAYRIHMLNRFVRGWMAYFRIAGTPGVFMSLDKWYRRRMRQICWKQWKRPATRRRMLASLGVPSLSATRWGASSKGPWRIAGSAVLQRALPTSYWTNQGLLSLHTTWRRFR
ncbi:MAG: group II intron reverse transcriptase/maturase [Propionicimonas sp.]|nr:group II intron reverse transcriptase/maturase [Propionicimonas sp.]MEA5116593.1 group II intron reverse transcriptase/maturase [Propionicimonas sp.]